MKTNEKLLENLIPVNTIYGIQPKGVKMTESQWNTMLPYMNVDQKKRTFKNYERTIR